jgi:three-Cys-motif partner protein
VLKRYIDAWFPVLGSWNVRILFIDGFAGPGQYVGGEPGSPIIALDALLNHTAGNVISAELGFIFIEKDEDRAAHLSGLVATRKPKLPKKCWAEVVVGSFESEMTRLLGDLEVQQKKLAPSFVMVDPFGVSGIPMSVLKRILQNSRCELYVSFMYESINRFIGHPAFESHLDAMFGCEDWREAIAIDDSEQRKRKIYNLYGSQLKAAGARQVVHFDVYEANRLVYAIFFATESPKGCDLMKQAIWKVAPFGNYAFRGSHSPQLGLGLQTTDFSALRKFVASEFRGKGWINVQAILEKVASDQCDYHTGQVKRGALKPMESDGALEVDKTTRNRRFTYPDGTRLKIVGE